MTLAILRKKTDLKKKKNNVSGRVRSNNPKNHCHKLSKVLDST
jgi:hypothetical protein